jgi:hypothetical protein
MFRHSLLHPQGVLLSLLKPPANCKVVIMVELQGVECIICGIFYKIAVNITTKQYYFNCKQFVKNPHMIHSTLCN